MRQGDRLPIEKLWLQIEAWISMTTTRWIILLRLELLVTLWKPRGQTRILVPLIWLDPCRIGISMTERPLCSLQVMIGKPLEPLSLILASLKRFSKINRIQKCIEMLRIPTLTNSLARKCITWLTTSLRILIKTCQEWCKQNSLKSCTTTSVEAKEFRSMRMNL